MLYLDYSRKAGEWIPNQYGGNENLEAIEFLRRFNELAHTVPGAFTVAEESTSFPGVSKPVYLNGLGFTMKWNMGWMHDMLDYFTKDPVFRKFHHNHITFSLLYAFHENFVLPISHDEVVHGKGSLLNKMPGDEWRQFANVRAFLAYMWAHPGKKLLFMGQEIGQREEWNHATGIRWELLEFDLHRKLQRMVRELNRLYHEQPAMYQVDFHHTGFEWVDFHDGENSIIAFLRRAEDPKDFVMFCCNFTPVPRTAYEFGVPEEGFYEEILNTDSEIFGGSNLGNGGVVSSRPIPRHDRKWSVAVTLPPLAVVAFKKR
jgi:1,4-alpha-glucan branching enzyme